LFKSGWGRMMKKLSVMSVGVWCVRAPGQLHLNDKPI
jgi:hypothetical protein